MWKGRKSLYVWPAMFVNEIKLLKNNRNCQSNVKYTLSSYKVLTFLSTYYATAKNWDINKKLHFHRQIICDPLGAHSSCSFQAENPLCKLTSVHGRT